MMGSNLCLCHGALYKQHISLRECQNCPGLQTVGKEVQLLTSNEEGVMGVLRMIEAEKRESSMSLYEEGEESG